ncbi:hypothetical protein BJV77DRAFT_645353 [Russula vinacea]|nr:hypothetical protein BJV77DRAFT_645353 [Russula vinacea]
MCSEATPALMYVTRRIQLQLSDRRILKVLGFGYVDHLRDHSNFSAVVGPTMYAPIPLTVQGFYCYLIWTLNMLKIVLKEALPWKSYCNSVGWDQCSHSWHLVYCSQAAYMCRHFDRSGNDVATTAGADDVQHSFCTAWSGSHYRKKKNLTASLVILSFVLYIAFPAG